MDLRIAVTHSIREIELQLAEDTDTKKLKEQIATAMASETEVLWLSDRRGKVVGVPGAKIAWVEIGSESDARSIGFSS